MRARIVLLYSLLRLIEMWAVFLADCGRWFQSGLDNSCEGREAMQVTVALGQEIAAPADVVWNFVHDPATASITGGGIVQGFTLPDTPRGCVGERQCFVHQLPSGGVHTHVIEVVELTPGQRAVTVAVPFDGIYTTTTVSGQGSVTLLTMQAAGTPAESAGPQAVSRIAATLEEYLLKVQWALGGQQTGQSPA